jgi:hypothetical protein
MTTIKAQNLIKKQEIGEITQKCRNKSKINRVKKLKENV